MWQGGAGYVWKLCIDDRIKVTSDLHGSEGFDWPTASSSFTSKMTRMYLGGSLAHQGPLSPEHHLWGGGPRRSRARGKRTEQASPPAAQERESLSWEPSSESCSSRNGRRAIILGGLPGAGTLTRPCEGLVRSLSP